LDSGKIRVKGMASHFCADDTFGFVHLYMQVTDVFKLEEYQAALDKMNSRSALKIAIRP
jgi:hypothetical protein